MAKSKPSVVDTARRLLARPASEHHWPTQPLVDGRAAGLLERWAYCLAIIASLLGEADHGASYGTGQAELRTRLQRGGDFTAGRLDWGPDDEQPDRFPWEGAPRLADAEKKALYKLRDRALERLAYDLAWLERQPELEPPAREAAG